VKAGKGRRIVEFCAGHCGVVGGRIHAARVTGLVGYLWYGARGGCRLPAVGKARIPIRCRRNALRPHPARPSCGFRLCRRAVTLLRS